MLTTNIKQVIPLLAHFPLFKGNSVHEMSESNRESRFFAIFTPFKMKITRKDVMSFVSVVPNTLLLIFLNQQRRYTVPDPVQSTVHVASHLTLARTLRVYLLGPAISPASGK